MNPLIQLKKAAPAFLVGVVFFGLLPAVQAVSPVPDGGYPRGNTAEGQNALLSLTTGGFNTAVGWFSLKSLTTGSFNTGVGAGTLVLNSGDENTATGVGALLLNTTGGSNTAIGAFALFNNTTGLATAIGKGALFSNTTGSHNTANGLNALFSNTTGSFNTANGDGALYGNTTGSDNVANGYFALVSNTTANFNTANGTDALKNNTGGNNTADGADALLNNTTANDNTADGADALLNDTTGSGNVALGFDAGSNVTTANSVISIGSFVAGANVDNSCFIGNIYGVTTQSGTTAPVVVSDEGQLGTMASSERFKKDISTMKKASEAILALRPVTFHYKSDTKNAPQFGLIAEEVAKVNPALVLPDKKGKPYTVRYDAVNVMLLNEFLKEHKALMEEHRTVEELKKEVAALTAGLQKVSGQLELNKSAPQVAENHQ